MTVNSDGSRSSVALGLIFDDMESAVFDPIAQRNRSAHPDALPFRRSDLVRIRSPVISRSNWAKDSSMLRVSRPMLVVVLKAWDRDEGDAVRVEQLDQLGEVGKRAR